MSIEAGKLKDDEEKKKILSKEQIQSEEQKQQEYKKLKEENDILSNQDINLAELEELLEKGIISQEVAKNLIDGKNIGKEDIEEIFTKINQIEDIKDIDKYLPKELRITKDEYFKAFEDKVFRTQILVKINTALTIIGNQINGDTPLGLNLFSGFLIVLDKNLVLIQENNIDIKNSLEKLEERRKLTFWEKIKKFFYDLLLNK